MAVIQLSWVNLGDAATLAGGNWQGTLPRSNLQDRIMSRVARTNGTGSSATRVDIGLAVTLPARIIALFRHNCTVDATYRITAGTTQGGITLYDSGTLDVWPADMDTAEKIAGFPSQIIHDCGSDISAAWWRFQINDTTNPAGYIQAGRLWLGPAWSPTRSYSFGAALGYESRTEEERSLGGVLYFDERTPLRVFNFTLDNLDADDFGDLLEMQRKVGTFGEVIVIPDPADTTRALRRNFIGRLRKSDPIRQVAFASKGASFLHSSSFEVEELL